MDSITETTHRRQERRAELDLVEALREIDADESEGRRRFVGGALDVQVRRGRRDHYRNRREH